VADPANVVMWHQNESKLGRHHAHDTDEQVSITVNDDVSDDDSVLSNAEEQIK
jgi:hypothetical protein